MSCKECDREGSGMEGGQLEMAVYREFLNCKWNSIGKTRARFRCPIRYQISIRKYHLVTILEWLASSLSFPVSHLVTYNYEYRCLWSRSWAKIEFMQYPIAQSKLNIPAAWKEKLKNSINLCVQWSPLPPRDHGSIEEIINYIVSKIRVSM